MNTFLLSYLFNYLCCYIVVRENDLVNFCFGEFTVFSFAAISSPILVNGLYMLDKNMETFFDTYYIYIKKKYNIYIYIFLNFGPSVRQKDKSVG